MGEKNVVINDYVGSLLTMVGNLNNTLSKLVDNVDVNTGVIKTADIQITAINSQIVVLQSELDNYFGG